MLKPIILKLLKSTNWASLEYEFSFIFIKWNKEEEFNGKDSISFSNLLKYVVFGFGFSLLNNLNIYKNVTI